MGDNNKKPLIRREKEMDDSKLDLEEGTIFHYDRGSNNTSLSSGKAQGTRRQAIRRADRDML